MSTSVKTEKNEKVLVVGNGWSACASVALLQHSGVQVIWHQGSGSRVEPALVSLEASPGARAWQELAHLLGIEPGDLVGGQFTREFRNRSFRLPAWAKIADPQARDVERNESLWGPELPLGAATESRFTAMTLAEVDEAIRRKIAEFETVRVVADDPIEEVLIDKGAFQAVRLGSGKKIAADRLVFADRWSELPNWIGLPKPLPFTRKRETFGLLQVRFTHSRAIGTPPVTESFFGAIQREASEDFQRQVWGHFSSDGCSSLWTVALGTEEIEDNHEIAKKLRRMKQSLDKMFTGVAWLGTEGVEFSSTIESEQVRFEENTVIGEGEILREPSVHPKCDGAVFLTDGYGPAAALEQVFSAFGRNHDLSRPLTAEWSASTTSGVAAVAAHAEDADLA